VFEKPIGLSLELNKLTLHEMNHLALLRVLSQPILFDGHKRAVRLKKKERGTENAASNKKIIDTKVIYEI
jgi:hypothetical protein